MEYEKTCPICGRRFVASRRDALCCSASCRKQKVRLARLEQDEQRIIGDLRMAPPRPQRPRAATTENIADALTELKGCTTALRYFARSCNPIIRPRLTVLADCIDEAMKEVGF